MLWFFERGDERLQCEIRPSTEVAGYELEWVEHGQVYMERSVSVDELAKRWAELEQEWKRNGWVKIGDAINPQKPQRPQQPQRPERSTSSTERK